VIQKKQKRTNTSGALSVFDYTVNRQKQKGEGKIPSGKKG